METETCECGTTIEGESQKHLKYLFKRHKRGQPHKAQMELKRRNG